MNEPEHTTPDKSTELAEQRTDLALQRTIIAAERTLMAWIRTSISMIGFGFTIYKFFQYLRQGENIAAVVARPQAPRNLGLAFIILGTLSLIAAVWQHWEFMKRIGATEKRYLWSLSVIIAICVVLIGIIAFIGVQLRTGPF